MPTQKIQYIYDSLKGLRRKSNKDGFGIYSADANHYTLFAIFDGVSSLRDAKNGVNLADRHLKKNAYKYSSQTDIDLRSIIYDLNKVVTESNYYKAYTTCTILAIPKIKDDNIKVASIGDSRVYGITKQFIKQLTVDDKDEDNSNVITKYLGMDDLSKNEIFQDNISKEFHEFLLCTDGFYSIFEDNKIDFHNTITSKNIRATNDKIRKLIKGKNNDDATYILVRA